MSANENTLFDLKPFEREDTKGKTDAEVRKVKVHVKKTEYERRVPTRKGKSASATAARTRQPKKTIAERFADYHGANPHVLKMLVALALTDRRAGMTHGGMQMYIEQVRFRMRKRVTTGEPFKISNDFAAYYARKIMSDVPELDGFFEVRELKSK